ncbi:unnamed protein product [Owenia fusiformis]|uniref:Uncharacterized protein n=1 Tax=Owenia fusiformis TaxID=6347 RepID=A0A8J1UM25_OWEFU|nr:unnamed protein product [Owenia fusiformis]
MKPKVRQQPNKRSCTKLSYCSIIWILVIIGISAIQIEMGNKNRKRTGVTRNRFPIAEWKHMKPGIDLLQNKINEQKIVLKDIENEIKLKKKVVSSLDVGHKPVKPTKVKPLRKRKRSYFSTNTDHMLGLCQSQQSKRRRKTVELIQDIHGDKNENVECGLFNTWIHTSRNKNKTLSNSRVVQKYLKKKTHEESVQYEKSIYNKIRSMKVLYKGGLISREKYCSIRKTLKKPKLLEYKALVKFRNSICPVTTEPIPAVNGRKVSSLEDCLLVLANMYIGIDRTVGNVLEWFNGNIGEFHVTIGADGAPFGKCDTSTALLVGFANLPHKVRSCSHNYIVFGANCAESHPEMMKLYYAIGEEMKEIEKSSYEIDGYEFDISFKFSFFPNDSKMIACLAGELTNSATFPTTFYDVSKNNISKIDGTIGVDFKPWDYGQRLKVVQEVEKLKKSNSNIARQKVTQFIASKKSRQEFIPPFGAFVSRARVDPLHCKNNSFQQLNECIITEALSNSPNAVLNKDISISQLPNCQIKKYFNALEKIGAGKLKYRLEKWYLECRKKGQPLSVRFTGEDCLKFCRGFCDVIQAVMPSSLSNSSLFNVAKFTYAFVHLRICASLFSRVEISQIDVENLEYHARLYFNCVALFFGKISLTQWLIGYAIPRHTEEIYEEFGYGLGLNSTQGREAKHRQIKKYVEHSVKSKRWETCLRHDWVENVWLKSNDLSGENYSKNSDKALCIYHEDDSHCLCGNTLPCSICSSDVFNLIDTSCKEGKVVDSLKNI